MTQAADWRSGPRWSATSMLYLVHPFASSRHFTHREACHWIRGSLLSPMNPVPLPPQGETRALRDWLSVSYSMISVLVISRYAAPPYPAAPDFPPSGGQNKTPRNILFISISTVSTGCCAPSKRGKGGGVSHQRGNAFPRPSGRLYGFRCRQAAYKIPL